MKKIALPLLALILTACSASDIGNVSKQFETSLKKAIVGRKPSSRPTPSGIAIANTAGTDCKGVTVHSAYIEQSPFYYGGKVISTIPIYRVIISNTGNRKKAIFDIDYTVNIGNAKYRTKQPTRYGTKELSPKTIRANLKRAHISLGKTRDHRGVFTRVTLVECQ